MSHLRFVTALVVGLFVSGGLGSVCFSQATLRLNDGDIFQGDFYKHEIQRDSTSDNTAFLLWKCNAFLEPMVVPWNVVDSISQNLTNEKVKEIDETQLYVVEFENGESISGRIEQLDERTIKLTSNRYAPTQIDLDRIRAILRVHHSSYEGVGRLSVNEWKQVLPAKKKDVPDTWLSKAGSIETAIAGSSIAQTGTLPSLAVVDVDVAWTHSNPNWTLTVGNNLPKLELRVRKLEQRDELSITLLFEEESVADIVTVMIPSMGVESLRLKILCDLEEGRFVLQQNGRAIGEIASQSKSKPTQSKLDNRVRFQVTNDAPGGMILRELKVSRSPFSMTRTVEGDSVAETSSVADTTSAPVPDDRLSKVLLTTGKSHIGVIKANETQSGGLRLDTIDGEKLSIAISDIERVEYAMKSAKGPSDPESITEPPNQEEYCVVQTKDGERFAGKTLKHSKDQLTLICSSLPTPIGFSVNDVSSIQFISNVSPVNVNVERAVLMKLVCDEVHSNGKLVPSENVKTDTLGSGWAWRPAGLSGEFLINPSINGTIDIIRNGTEARPTDGQARNLSLRTDIYGRSLDPGEPALYLASGDSLPGKLVRLDNGTLTFSSELFGESSLDASQVKGIRQLVYTGTDRLDDILLKRLLTVPRMARQSPPAHLVVSRDGDMIRGNVTFIDEDLLRIEVREEEREIWMKNVAEIVWLDPAPKNSDSDKPTDTSTDNGSVDSAEPDRQSGELSGVRASCQLVMSKGSVVSLIPGKIEDGLLLGVHPLLGECNIPLEQTIQILFGNEMEKSRSTSRFAKWKLRHAIDPKFVSEEADAASGEASELVGKPAVDFELKALDGKVINLSALRGRVVVLDFWASWCGPCRKSLPVIQRIAEDFGNEAFSFYAVNVDEEPNVVQGSAIVLGISNNCLLDPKGTISKAYGASAIPYTVVIDKEGIVRRVFVGANDEAFNTLRESISKYLENDSQ
ncbi:MAG: TlpA family protein disulfide reductase [Pirellula sp.]|jgi:thiol-disulfide isomerase/thioredoxin